MTDWIGEVNNWASSFFQNVAAVKDIKDFFENHMITYWYAWLGMILIALVIILLVYYVCASIVACGMYCGTVSKTRSDRICCCLRSNPNRVSPGQEPPRMDMPSNRAMSSNINATVINEIPSSERICWCLRKSINRVSPGDEPPGSNENIGANPFVLTFSNVNNVDTKQKLLKKYANQIDEHYLLRNTLSVTFKDAKIANSNLKSDSFKISNVEFELKSKLGSKNRTLKLYVESINQKPLNQLEIKDLIKHMVEVEHKYEVLDYPKNASITEIVVTSEADLNFEKIKNGLKHYAKSFPNYKIEIERLKMSDSLIIKDTKNFSKTTLHLTNEALNKGCELLKYQFILTTKGQKWLIAKFNNEFLVEVLVSNEQRIENKSVKLFFLYQDYEVVCDKYKTSNDIDFQETSERYLELDDQQLRYLKYVCTEEIVEHCKTISENISHCAHEFQFIEVDKKNREKFKLKFSGTEEAFGEFSQYVDELYKNRKVNQYQLPNGYETNKEFFENSNRENQLLNISKETKCLCVLKSHSREATKGTLSAREKIFKAMLTINQYFGIEINVVNSLMVNLKECDAVVTLVDQDYKPYGDDSKQVFSQAGYALTEHLEEMNEEKEKYFGQILCTESYELKKFKQLFHVVLPEQVDDVEHLLCLVRENTKECLKMALSSSIAFPLLDFSDLIDGSDLSEAIAVTMITSILSFFKECKTSSLRLIIFSGTQARTIRTTLQMKFSSRLRLEEISNVKNSASKSAVKGAASYSIFISSTEEKNIEEASRRIAKIIELDNKTKPYPLDHNLNDEQLRRMQEICKENGTTIEINQTTRFYKITGPSDYITKSKQEIDECIKTSLKREVTIAKITNKIIWEYKYNFEWMAYDEGTNAKIEEAYDSKKDVVSFTNHNGDQCIIDFATNRETNGRTRTEVRRRDANLGTFKFPKTWEANKESNLIELDTRSPEYGQCTALIIQNRMKDILQGIVKIERVQNSRLYIQYENAKRDYTSRISWLC